MKLLLQPDNYQQIVDNQAYLSGIIVGIDSLSVNVAFLCDEKAVAEIISSFPEQEVFVCLNKNYQNSDLSYLAEVLKRLSKLAIAGILFYDFAVVNLNEELQLNHNLIWHAEHFTTNHYTFSVLSDYQVNGMVLSLDMPYTEMQTISAKTENVLFLPVFGYYPIFNSVRHLGKNYFAYFNLKVFNDEFYLWADGYKLLMIDDKNGTSIYHPALVDGSSIINELDKVDYGIINGFRIANEDLAAVIKQFYDGKKITGLVDNLSEEIFLQQTIYRLKGEKK